ncbi:hypothetical protein RND81_06G160400 [Saponaria officinalis]|uniref:RING-type E3 ubiquitin transferase n=1 Tax=Saponaria officinalis TaxID=3572 RepID=A0AAW1KDV1_SAPOF
MLPKSIIRPAEKEANTLLTFFFVFFISISTKLANAHDDEVDFTSSNFQPSLFVVIGVLSVMFSMTLLLLIYAKWCHCEPTNIQNHDNHVHSHSNRGMFGAHTRFSGLNLEVVESLPFFRFSSLRGAKHGLQCSVCLTDFEEIEILRLLPKCKHGFHIECIDQWLKSHSSCPLCRQKVCSEDLSLLVNSRSMRLIVDGKSNVGDTSNFEVFVEREDSFRGEINSKNDNEIDECRLHKVNHRIVMSDVVFKNRWSDVRSSDLMFLNSEILGFMSSDRFSSSHGIGAKHDSMDFEGSCDQYSTMKIREEMEKKIMFENKFGKIKKSSSKNDKGVENSRPISSISADKRAMSEITALSRFKNLMNNKQLKDCYNDLSDENVGNDINRRRKWLHIAKTTVKWFASRENNRFLQHQQQENCHGKDDIHTSLDV